MTITYNWGYLNSSWTTPLSTDGDVLKARILATYSPVEDTEYDAALQKSCLEAVAVIDNILLYYTAILPSDDRRNPAIWKTDNGEGISNTPAIIAQICADVAVSFFRRRLLNKEVHLKVAVTPTDSNKTKIDADFWYGQGISKLMQFIESNYKKPKFHLYGPDDSSNAADIGGYKEIT